MLCKHEVVGSIPSGSTRSREARGGQKTEVGRLLERLDIPMKYISLKIAVSREGCMARREAAIFERERCDAEDQSVL